MASISRNTYRRLFSLEGGNMWNMEKIISLPISVKVVILVAGMCVGIGFLLCEEAGDKKDTKPLDEKSKS